MTVIVNRELCAQCGVCVDDCPLRLLSAGEDGVPVFSQERPCVKCGHCEASCPEAALTLTDTGFLDISYPIEKTLEKEAFASLVRTRRSVRQYEDRPVANETIDALFDVVRFAPTASNRQIVEWVLLGQERIELLTAKCMDFIKEAVEKKDPISERLPLEAVLSAHKSGRNPIFFNAPHVALTHTDAQFLTGPLDSAIALTHLDLALSAHGLGGCWAGLFLAVALNHPSILKDSGVRDGHVLTGAMMFGHTQHRYWRIPRRRAAQVVRL